MTHSSPVTKCPQTQYPSSAVHRPTVLLELKLTIINLVAKLVATKEETGRREIKEGW